MPICVKCEARFPCRIKISDKWHHLASRKHCLNCVPFGGIESIPDGERRSCAGCGREFTLTRSKGHRPSQCNSCSQMSRRALVKAKCVAYKGGACQRCGYSRCIAALGFHHVDEETKLFQISGNENRAWEVVKAELDKCIMLCANCHTEVHFLGEDVSQLLCFGNSVRSECLPYKQEAASSNLARSTKIQ